MQYCERDGRILVKHFFVGASTFQLSSKTKQLTQKSVCQNHKDGTMGLPFTFVHLTIQDIHVLFPL